MKSFEYWDRVSLHEDLFIFILKDARVAIVHDDDEDSPNVVHENDEDFLNLV